MYIINKEKIVKTKNKQNYRKGNEKKHETNQV